MSNYTKELQNLTMKLINSLIPKLRYTVLPITKASQFIDRTLTSLSFPDLLAKTNVSTLIDLQFWEKFGKKVHQKIIL